MRVEQIKIHNLPPVAAGGQHLTLRKQHNSTANNKRFDKQISDKQNFLISSLLPDFGMSILYSVIARRTTVLARFASCIGNFSEITEVVLAKIWGSDSRPRGYDDKLKKFLLCNLILHEVHLKMNC